MTTRLISFLRLTFYPSDSDIVAFKHFDQIKIKKSK